MIGAVQMLEAQSHNTTFVWNDMLSQIDLHVTTDDALLPGKPYYFKFNVTNPVNKQPEQPITVESSSFQFSIAAQPVDHDMTTIPISDRSFAGEAAALLVLEPQFLVQNIGQSTPYPNALNKITVTLVANIPLGSEKDIARHSNITIVGLVGSETHDTTSLVISQTSPSNRILSQNGTWVQDEGRLVLSIINNSKWNVDDAAIIFAFEITNPGKCMSSPAINVSAQAAATECAGDIPSTPMVKDSTSVPFDQCRACGVAAGHCEACRGCDERCDQQDAHPLKVHAPAFVIKEIGQSTTWPGAENTISVTIALNIDLTSAAAIFISGF